MLTKKEQLYKSYVVPEFSNLMIKQLAKHDDRGDSWKDENEWWLLKRAQEELKEVEKALDGCSRMGYTRREERKVARECADVANFMMMIIDQVGGI